MVDPHAREPSPTSLDSEISTKSTTFQVSANSWMSAEPEMLLSSGWNFNWAVEKEDDLKPESSSSGGISNRVKRIHALHKDKSAEIEVIDLSSDSEREESYQSTNVNDGTKKGQDEGPKPKTTVGEACSSSNEEEDSGLKLMTGWRELQILGNDEFKWYENGKKKASSARELNTNFQEVTTNKVTQIVCPNRRSGEPQQGTSREAVAETLIPAEDVLGKWEGKFDDRKNLKRKLLVLTKELSKSRMEQAKKLRRDSVDPEKLVIEILEFPEFYNMAVDLPVRNGNMTEYFCSLNKHSNVKDNPTYSAWIQERVLNLLPKVLTVMVTDWVEKSSSLRHHLKAEDLLTCRLVSKSWQRSVDKMLQSDENKSGLTIKTVIASKDLDCILEMIRIWERPTGPFPSRALVIDDVLPHDDNYSPEEFIRAVHTLLGQYGAHLTSFTYIGYQDNVEFFGYSWKGWAVLKQWLTNMPNLAEFHFQLGDAGPRIIGSVEEERLQQSRALLLHQLPIMPKLHTVGFQQISGFFIDVLLAINPRSLKNISILSASPDEQLILYEEHMDLKIAEFSINISKLAQLDAMMCVQWPLRKLTITSSISTSTPVSLMCLTHVFRCVEKFSKTLQHLDLSIGVIPSIANNDIQLKLPKLENLSICLTESGPSSNGIAYDFLLPLATLKQLEVVIAYQDNTDHSGNYSSASPSQIIQFKGYLHHMYDSNIWNLFPSLKSIKVQLTQDDNVPSVCTKYKYTKDAYDIYTAAKTHLPSCTLNLSSDLLLNNITKQ